jgi:hypothetical protein
MAKLSLILEDIEDTVLSEIILRMYRPNDHNDLLKFVTDKMIEKTYDNAKERDDYNGEDYDDEPIEMPRTVTRDEKGNIIIKTPCDYRKEVIFENHLGYSAWIEGANVFVQRDLDKLMVAVLSASTTDEQAMQVASTHYSAWVDAYGKGFDMALAVAKNEKLQKDLEQYQEECLANIPEATV